MRGKHNYGKEGKAMTKITPADAGKTCLSMPAAWAARDHPRGCGENTTSDRKTQCRAGSPPQVRGKLAIQIFSVVTPGITPAGAGKTRQKKGYFFSSRDHPRRCGENLQYKFLALSLRGSPPQVRGKRGGVRGGIPRITPAGAGKTNLTYASFINTTDHPRRCGENGTRSHR